MTRSCRARLRRSGWLLLPFLLPFAAVALTGPGSGEAGAQAAGETAGQPGGGPGSGTPAEAPANPEGQNLYLRDCGVCHGPEGGGSPRGQSLREISPAEADYSMTTGRMPIAEPGDERRRRPVKYKREEIDAILEYMRPFLTPEPEIPKVDIYAGKLSEGLELYAAECASCHQWGGVGGALLGREAPSLHKATPTQVAEAIRTGPTTMPEYGEDVMSEHQMNSVVRYVMYLRSPQDRGGHPIWHFGPFAEGLVGTFIGLGVLILAVLWIGERGLGEKPQGEE